MKGESMGNRGYKSILHKMTQQPDSPWNDPCSIDELTNSIEHGAVGATCNPVIVNSVLKQDWDIWKIRIPQIILENPTSSEDEIAWKLIEEMSVKAAAVLGPYLTGKKAEWKASLYRQIQGSTGMLKVSSLRQSTSVNWPLT